MTSDAEKPDLRVKSVFVTCAMLFLQLVRHKFCWCLPCIYFREHIICWRPYRVECTGSLLTSEVKRHRARLVLGWGTAWEHLRVLSAFSFW